MFSFTKNQQEITLGDVIFGGQPGRHPTVLFGGMFFTGTPDYKKAKEDINIMRSMSEQTGIPGIVDFFIKKPEYNDEIISFIAENIPQHHPFSVDVTDPQVKISVLSLLDEYGLLDQTIYNSIHVGVTKEEIEALKNHTPKAAILVAFNPKDTSPDGKIEVLETGAHVINSGLFSIAKECGISNVLVDTAALAPGHNSGASIAAIPVIKEEYGLPTGCAIHNVVEKSKWISQISDAKNMVDVASNINISLFGGDFAIFGAITNAPNVFPLMAWEDILISEYAEHYFGITPSSRHPRRIFYP
jgi:tetrahydromethanopterin S-methyltransferase subunit H